MSNTGPERPRRDDTDGVIDPLRFLSGGMEFAITCTAGTLGGRWIDGRLGTDPWFTAALLIVAFATGTWLLLRRLAVIGDGAGRRGGSRES